MKLTTLDPRPISVAVQRIPDPTAVPPVTVAYFNWKTGAWEYPFVASAHLVPFAVNDPGLTLTAGVKSVEVGTVLLGRSDVVPLMVATGAGGVADVVTDVWTLPSPMPEGVSGAYGAGAR